MLTLARQRLAAWVERDRDPEVATRIHTTVDLDVLTSLGPHKPVIGFNLPGDPVGIDFRNEPHAMIIGRSRRGKSTTTRTYMCGRLRSNARIIIIAGGNKRGNYRFAEHQVSTVTTEAGITAALKWLTQERERRQEETNTYTDPSGNGVDHYRDIPGNDGPIDVVLEEIASLIGKGNLFDPRVVDTWFKYITQLARLGGEVDIHLIGITQIGTLISFGSNEASNGIRSSMGARLTHDAGRQNLEVLTDGQAPPTLQTVQLMEQGGKGRMAYVNLDDQSNGQIQVGQAIFLTQAQARWCAEQYAGPEPIRFDPSIKEFA